MGYRHKGAIETVMLATAFWSSAQRAVGICREFPIIYLYVYEIDEVMYLSVQAHVLSN